jgi:LPS-assembly lipoprotein
MSSSEFIRRSASFIIVVVMLSMIMACGFRPVYGTQDSTYAAQEVTASIKISPIKDRVGQRIRNELIRQLTPNGEPYDAPYLMTLHVTVSERNAFTATDRDIDRISVLVSARFQVIDTASLPAPDTEIPPAPIYADTAFAESSFTRFPSEFANIRARQDAENRAATEVATLIRNQVIAAIVAGSEN